jgi:uncharacterized alpha-E superfamily protein
MERTDGILRMLKVNYASSQEDQHEFSWKPVLRIFTYVEEKEAIRIGNQSRDVLQFMVTDKENPNSVVNIVTTARESARGVQDHITKELWQCLNDYYHAMRDDRLILELHREDPVTVLDLLIKRGLLYYGTTDVTMARGEGYAFMNIGRFLERGIQSADILDIKFSDVHYDFTTTDTTYWKYLLLSISGYEIYLKKYRSGFDARNVVEQIVLSPDFPRSLLYSIRQLQRYFRRLKRDQNAEAFLRIDFMIGKINSTVEYSTVDAIMENGLHPYLRGIKQQLFEVGNALNQYYFAYT